MYGRLARYNNITNDSKTASTKAGHDITGHDAHQRGERQGKIGLALAIVAPEFLER